MLTLTEFRPGLWLTELHLEPFDVRGAVVIGHERAVVWDTLSHPRDMQALQPLVQNKWLAVVYSHADWDHCWGTAGLPTRQVVIGHTVCHARFFDDVPTTLAEKQATQSAAWDEVALIPPTFTFQHDLTLDLGGVTLHLHHLPGHTPDCLVGFIPEWGILLAGDTIETPLPVVNEDSPLEAWIAALEQWEQTSAVQTVIPAHGRVGGRDLASHTRTYLHQLRTGTLGEPTAGLSEFYCATDSANRRYAQIR